MLTVKRLKDYLNSLDEGHDDWAVFVHDYRDGSIDLQELPSFLRKSFYVTVKNEFCTQDVEDSSIKKAIIISDQPTLRYEMLEEAKKWS